MKNNKTQYVWWPSDITSFDQKAICASFKAALREAQEQYDKKVGPYYSKAELNFSPIINIGELKLLPLQKFCREFAEDIPRRIEEDMGDNFTSGMDCEAEVCISKKDEELFYTKIANTLFGLISSKHVHYYPMHRILRYPRRYDLRNREWVPNGLKATRIEAEEIREERVNDGTLCKGNIDILHLRVIGNIYDNHELLTKQSHVDS